MNTMKKWLTIIFTVVVCICSQNSIYAQSTEDYMNQGNVLLGSGAYDQAVTQFKKVLARDPRNFEAQFNLALSYLNWGKDQNAVTEFKKATTLNSKNADAWSNLATAYEHLGQSKLAMEALDRAVAADPKNIRVRMNLASVNASKGNVDRAIAEYKAIINIDGTTYDAFINLAKCYVSKKMYDEAKLNLKTASGVNPSEGEAYWQLGNIMWKQDKDQAGALSNFKKASSMKPNVADYYESIALLQEEMWKTNKDEGKKKDAIDTWNKYLIYTDDAIRKDEIRQRITMLESGKEPSSMGSSSSSSADLFGSSDVSKQNVDALRSEMGKKSIGKDTLKKIKVQSYNVNNDLISVDTTNTSFDFDKAMQEKKKKKK